MMFFKLRKNFVNLQSLRKAFFAKKIFLFIVKIFVKKICRKKIVLQKNYFSEKVNLRVN